jgi:hypothetical protein
MPGAAYSIYAQDLAESAQGSVLSWSSQAYTQTSAGTTPYMPVVAPQGMNLAAIYVYASAVVTPNAATTVVSGTDILDVVMNGYEVTNSVGGASRCRTITRKGAEEAERLFVQPPTSTTFAYPRSSAATFTATTAATTTAIRWIIPAAGGTAANVRISYPGAGQAYTTSASITSISVTYYLYAIPTLSSVTTAFTEVITPQIPSGMSDLRTYQPDGISADFVDIVGGTWGTTGSDIEKVVVDGQGGIGRTVDYEDVYAANDLQTLYPISNSAANQSNVLVNLHQQRADHFWVTTAGSISAGLDLLFCQITDEATVTPAPAPASTASTPLTSIKGQIGPGATVAASGRASGVTNKVAGRRVA